MYKKQFIQETNIQESDNSVFLVTMNKKMEAMLNRYGIIYKDIVPARLPAKLYRYLEKGIEFRPDEKCYTYKSVKEFTGLYEDLTGNEASGNEIFCCDYPNLPSALKIFLNFIFSLARLLEKFPESFNIYLSYNITGINGFSISFNCIRPSEPSWLSDNLDAYREEAIFVLTTNGSRIFR